MFNIMILKNGKANDSSAEYGFLTNDTAVNGKVDKEITMFESLEAAEKEVEKLLNEGTYRKTELIVVERHDFNIDATFEA